MYNYHCSKCKKPCKKKDNEWSPNCDCGIRCSPSWSPPRATAFSEGITRAFSLTEPEPEPEPEPIGEWLSQDMGRLEVKKGVKVVPIRIEKNNPDKPSGRAYRVKKGVEENSDKSKMKSRNKSRKKTKRRKSRNKSRKSKTKRRKSRNKSKRRKINK